jgi:hypothetical protein
VDRPPVDDTVSARVGALARWRDRFAVDGRASRALNVLIDRYGNTLGAAQLMQLTRLPLHCPPQSRLQLELVLAIARHGDPQANAALLELAQRATCADVRQTLGLVRIGTVLEQRALRELLDCRDDAPLTLLRCASFAFEHLAHLLVGRSLPRNMSLHAFTASIIQRRQEERRLLETQHAAHAERIHGDGAGDVHADHGHVLPTPPIPLPTDQRVRFLRTVGDVLNEANVMQHCVRSHLPRAVLGRVWLFHVEDRGEHATIEVDKEGRIVECNGPRNQPNGAVEVARTLLHDWGAPLRLWHMPLHHAGPRMRRAAILKRH